MKSKTKPSFSNIFVRSTGILMMLVILISSVSCGDDKESKPDTRALFVGTFEVEETSASNGEVYNYDITIENGEGGGLAITNFGDIFNVPVKATTDGSKIVIKSQSFTNGGSGNTIEVTGEGTVEGDVLTLTYTTSGWLKYTGNCIATKKQ